LRFALLALAAIALGSCADDDHEFTTYSGAQQKWPYAPGAFVSTVAGMQVFEEGLPNRPYAVIGKLLVERRRGPIIQEGVVKEARRYGADGLLIVSSKTFNNGALNMTNLTGNLYGSGFSATGVGVTVPLRFREADVWLIKFL
jgi:hypothetical protein